MPFLADPVQASHAPSGSRARNACSGTRWPPVMEQALTLYYCFPLGRWVARKPVSAVICGFDSRPGPAVLDTLLRCVVVLGSCSTLLNTCRQACQPDHTPALRSATVRADSPGIAHIASKSGDSNPTKSAKYRVRFVINGTSNFGGYLTGASHPGRTTRQTGENSIRIL